MRALRVLHRSRAEPLTTLGALAQRYALSGGQVAQLEVLLELVAGNAEAPTTVTARDGILRDHLADSLVALDLPEVRAATAIADLGAGAGFPGLPLAIALPDARVSLVESNGRKTAFITAAIEACVLGNATPVNARTESWPQWLGSCDLVTARALAPLGQLLAWADRYRTDTAICLFHKGKGWQAEVTEAMKDLDIPHQAFTSVTDLDAVILRIGPYRAAALRDRQPEGRRRQDHDGD